MDNFRVKKVLVLGLGNTIRGDDGAGIFTVRFLKKALNDQLAVKVDVKELEEANINILELLSGYDKIIIVDSITTGQVNPGNVFRFKIQDFDVSSHAYSTHQFGISKIFKMAEELGLKLPSDIIIYAVEIEKGNRLAGSSG